MYILTADISESVYKLDVYILGIFDKAKNEWLYKWCMDCVLDKVLIVPYGQCKADTCRQFGYGVLADDEEQNRNAWDLGETIDANKNLLKELAKLL